MEFAANLVWLIHVLFVLWFVITPFTNNAPMLALHFFTAVFLWGHWLVLRDECSLTLIEMKLRGIEDCQESFFWNIVSPIYKPRTTEMGKQILWLVSILLWLVTVSKVMKNPQMVADVFRAAMVPFKPTTQE